MSSLALCMIVRDAEAFLHACLESVRGLVHEVVIADTGSVDRTIEIASKSGVRLLTIPWNKDFSEARNKVLAEARCDWILSLDADEQLDSTAASPLPQLLENKAVAGYQVTIRNYVLTTNERVWDQTPKMNDPLLPSASKYPAFVEHENVRLFRRDPAIYFVGRVHESVGPRIKELHGHLGKANFSIHHFGLALDDETKLKKNIVYRDMGRHKIEESPNDWQAHFELGLLELEQFKNLASAQALFARSCELNPAMGVAWFFLGLTILRMGYCEDAVNFLRRAEDCGHKTALVAETRGDALYNLGQFEDARGSYEAALRRGHANPATEAKLCLTIVRTGRVEKGLGRLSRALSNSPETAELHEGLILSLVQLNRIEQAAEAAEVKLKAIPDVLAGDYLRAASLWAQVRNWTRAAGAVQKGLLAYPENGQLSRVLQEICQMREQVPIKVP